MYRITRDGCMFLIMGFTGKSAAAIKGTSIAAFNWMANQLSRRRATGEQAQHEYVIKERISKSKASLGSHFMHRRRREIPLLRDELEYVKALTAPDLFVGL